MDFSAILQNLLSPPILFFLAGMLAVVVRSDLEIPQAISRFLSLFLLFAIGLKGGHELAHGNHGGEFLKPLSLAVFFAVSVPFYTFYVLRKKLNLYDAGAIAATYGSVSAVTFVTAVSFLEQKGVAFGGQMIAALAIMESPAIVAGVMLVRRGEQKQDSSLKKVLHEAFTNGSVFVIISSLVVGLLVSPEQYQSVAPFSDGLFKGMLSLFMLDMGLIAAKRISGFKKQGTFLLLFSLWVPVVNALLCIAVCYLLQVSLGNAFLLTLLAASASYIAVPAAMRIAVPQSNPGIYVPMSLGITFPLNIIIGIPLYYSILSYLYS